MAAVSIAVIGVYISELLILHVKMLYDLLTGSNPAKPQPFFTPAFRASMPFSSCLFPSPWPKKLWGRGTTKSYLGMSPESDTTPLERTAVGFVGVGELVVSLV